MDKGAIVACINNDLFTDVELCKPYTVSRSILKYEDLLIDDQPLITAGEDAIWLEEVEGPIYVVPLLIKGEQIKISVPFPARFFVELVPGNAEFINDINNYK